MIFYIKVVNILILYENINNKFVNALQYLKIYKYFIYIIFFTSINLVNILT